MDTDSPLQSGMQDFTSGKYKSLPLCHDVSTIPFTKTVIHFQTKPGDTQLNEESILLVVWKDTELNNRSVAL